MTIVDCAYLQLKIEMDSIVQILKRFRKSFYPSLRLQDNHTKRNKVVWRYSIDGDFLK